MRKQFTLFALLAAGALSTSAQTEKQEIIVNRDLYQDYTPLTDYIYNPRSVIRKVDGEETPVRPEYVNNAETKYFPPVFSQVGGSCGSSSNESYNFTYEMNSLLDRDGSLPENQFPSHWIYLLAYQHSDREDVLPHNGIPNVTTYGGRTYSKLFGEQDCSDDFSGRMQGYDKWYSAMFNRAIRSARFRYDLSHEEGREELKQWMWNHQGDTDFHSGGIVCVGVAITGSKLASIPSRTANRKAGVIGKQYIASWGPTFDHSMTIVGYDDRIEFDLNGDRKYDEDEKGAWIICNSWGTGWANQGFVYCPYKYSYSVLTDTHPMEVGRWILRKHYKPERVFRITMDYSRRSELQLVAGVSENLNATKPDYTMVMPMFNYDGNPKNISPAPEVPMLGKWADGKMHTEPMEFGFDVTDLTDKVDKAKPLKYFLQINSTSDAIGEGSVRELCLMNYEHGSVADTIVGLQLGSEPVAIKNGGQTTYVTVTTQGLGNFRPTSLTCKSGVLTWVAPEASDFTLQQYLIYKGGVVADSVSAETLSYTLPDVNEEQYLQVSALYTDQNGQRVESKRTNMVSNAVKSNTSRATLSCDIDGTYLGYLREMATSGRLASLDIQEARIVEGGEAYYENQITANDELGKQAFYRANKLRVINLPKSIATIGEQAFSNCTALTAVEIPDEVISVGKDAFAYCSALSKVTVGSRVTNMNQGVCYSSPVKEVYAKPMTPPSMSIYVFSSKPTIHVYSEALEDYKASKWADYGTIVGDLEKYIPVTAIDEITDAPTSDAYYDLTGRRVEHPLPHHIYVHRGRKVIMPK